MPAFCSTLCPPVCYGVDEDEAVCSLVVDVHHHLELVLAGGVEDLQGHRHPVHREVRVEVRVLDRRVVVILGWGTQLGKQTAF